MKYFALAATEITRELRERWARGENVWLTLEGPLGAGKTTFTKELLAELGFPSAQVQSPTFLKLIEYPLSEGLCVHLDGYRMDEAQDYEKLALEQYAHARLWIVEWPALFEEYLKQNKTLQKILGLGSPVRVGIDGDHALTRD